MNVSQIALSDAGASWPARLVRVERPLLQLDRALVLARIIATLLSP